MKVTNVLEEIVAASIDEMLKEEEGVCRCEVCRNDMIAYALNKLPPLYVNSYRGEALNKSKILETQFKADIITAVCRAIETVKVNPRHG